VDFCEHNKVDQKLILKANGCGHCGGTGYYGRTAILDVMHMNDRLSTLLCNNQLTPGDMKQQGDKSFLDSLKKEGLQRVLAGKTTLSEVKRITASLG
jgi:type II secretory ATPase GspE/PulE/Tfp pilus assembly ATPase PilB-like protein